MVVIVCIIELSENRHWPVIVVAEALRLENFGSFTFLFTGAWRSENGNVPKFGRQSVDFLDALFMNKCRFGTQHWLHITICMLAMAAIPKH
jgi:hypothetical protein